jgi:alpha-beta hydrolase superfamily lysophospholipase
MPPFDAAFDSPVATRIQARSVWFGDPDAPLFGWFHPAEAQARDAVVVLCNPFGYDAGTTHHAYQKLAEQLAGAGVATLRFDYAGTGNSAGGDDGPGLLTAWLSSIDAAVAEARKRSGTTKVILFGVRFGALLATAYAQKSPVDGLVLLGPPRSGSTFVRELLVFNKMRSANPGEGASPDIEFNDDEVLGYALPSDLRADIAALDPRTSEERPAPRAMVIARDDVPGPEKGLVEHMRKLGVEVEHSHARGYSDVFDFRTLPPETLGDVISWIRSAHPMRPLASPPRGAEGPAAEAWADRPSGGRLVCAAHEDGLSEEAVRFRGLFGILTHPAAGSVPRETGILLLGTGANQHVGVNRMHVTLARALSKLGFRVLRFDLSGIGESPALPGLPARQFYTSQAVPETRVAIDLMMARGSKRVALFGLCSGGYTAFHTAFSDSRVAAIAAVNVPGFQYNPNDSRILAAHRPRSGLLSRWLGSRELRDDSDDVARGFGAVLARGCRTLIVYGSGDSGLPVLEGHLGPKLAKARGDQKLEMAVVPATDHTFTPRAAQHRLRSLVTQLFAGGLA